MVNVIVIVIVIVRQVNCLTRNGVFIGSCECRFGFITFTHVGDTELHAVGNDTHGVEQLPDHVDGLIADIGQEDDGHDTQNSHQTR